MGRAERPDWIGHRCEFAMSVASIGTTCLVKGYNMPTMCIDAVMRIFPDRATPAS